MKVFIVTCFSLFVSNLVLAQTPDEELKKLNIELPATRPPIANSLPLNMAVEIEMIVEVENYPNHLHFNYGQNNN